MNHAFSVTVIAYDIVCIKVVILLIVGLHYRNAQNGIWHEAVLCIPKVYRVLICLPY